MRRAATIVIALYVLAAGLLAGFLGFIGWAFGAQNAPLMVVPAGLFVFAAIGFLNAKPWGWWLVVLANFVVFAFFTYNVWSRYDTLPEDSVPFHVLAVTGTICVQIILLLRPMRAHFGIGDAPQSGAGGRPGRP